jgi:hypothetical protein
MLLIRIPLRWSVLYALCHKVCQWQVNGFLRILWFPPLIKLSTWKYIRGLFTKENIWLSWSYDSWIYNYMCNQFLSPLTLRILISVVYLFLVFLLMVGCSQTDILRQSGILCLPVSGLAYATPSLYNDLWPPGKAT